MPHLNVHDLIFFCLYYLCNCYSIYVLC